MLYNATNMMMKKTTLLLILAATLNTAEGKIEHLLPKPKITTISEGHFPLNKKVRITAGESTPLLLEFAEICGGTTTAKNAPEIIVQKVANIDGAYDYTLAGYPDEAYSLKIEPRKVTIKATTETGVIRAVQTMMQLSEGYDGTPALECAEIVDWPAFKLRGFMHDVGRSYIPIEEIKREIELLSRFKVNTFHFHLTENQAWRFEVKKYPQLTADSSMSRFPGKYSGAGETPSPGPGAADQPDPSRSGGHFRLLCPPGRDHNPRNRHAGPQCSIQESNGTLHAERRRRTGTEKHP